MKGLVCSFRKKLRDFELNISISAEGGIHGLVGPSGSGKSMALACIAGLETPDSGFIRLGDTVLYDSEARINLPPRERQVGFVFQNLALFPHLRVAEQIAYGLHHWPAADRNQRIREMTALVGLAGMEQVRVEQLSGGQRQRVALARALAPQPRLLLMDEPFSALDEPLRLRLIQDLRQELAPFRGATLFVTHQMDDALTLCKRISVICTGQLLAENTPQGLIEQPGSVEAAQILGYLNIAAYQWTGETVHIPAWQLTLRTVTPPDAAPEGHVVLTRLLPASESDDGPDLITAWEGSRSISRLKPLLFLKLGALPENDEDYHLIVEGGIHGANDGPNPGRYRIPEDGLIFITEEGSAGVL